jgi:hypothetical protein
MIEKVCTFPAVDEYGRQTIHLIEPGKGLEKVAYPLLPKVAEFAERLRHSPNKVHILVNALGASEYWGENINGDIFEEKSLIHDGPDYGYKTFYNAGIFQHHTNKDINKSFGKILLSEWNPLMKRVELIIALDRDLAEINGARSIIEKIDSGEFPDISMGCKVPYDLCSYCHDAEKHREALATYDPNRHRRLSDAVLAYHMVNPIRGLSRTSVDYCEHLRRMRGKILGDGRQIGMINTFPNFFDLSFVFIGADRTAKVMANLSSPDVSKSDTSYFPIKDVPVMAGQEKIASAYNMPLTKEASDFIKSALWGGPFVDKTAELGKESEIVKRVVSNFSDHVLPNMVEGEESIPHEIQDKLPEFGLSRILSTLGGLGMLLKPKEFQRIVIICMKKKPLADRLEDSNILFSPSEESVPMASLRPNLFTPPIADLLKHLIPRRSFHAPFIMRRAIKIKAVPSEDFKEINHPLLDKIGSAYNNYRQQLVDNVVPLTKQALFEGPPLLPPETLKPGAVPVVYMMQSHAPREVHSPDLEKGYLNDFVKEHPWLMASMVGGGLFALAKKLKIK